jgi:hypothetical protein
MIDYREALKRIHAAVRPRTYVEIGVGAGGSLRLADTDALCIGIDPAPRVPEDLALRVRLEAMTSDAFFAGPRAPELLGTRPIDLAVIDGMHLFEFALRDFINLEAFAGPRTLIVAHDCLPRDAVTAARRRTTRFWTGDVWKLVPALRAARPDLQISLALVPPTGLCLISGLRPDDTSLREAYPEIVARYVPKGFEEWKAQLREAEGLVVGLDEALARAGFGA